MVPAWANREQRSFQRLGHRLRLRVAAGNEQASLAPSKLPLRSDRRSLGSVCHQRTSRSTSRIWRIAVLSAGIRSLLWTAKGTDLCRLRHGAPPTAPALDRAAIDANDRSEPSISTTIAARQTRRPRKCSGARVSRIPVVEDTFRQRSPNFKPLQRYNRCAARVTPSISARYLVPV